MPFGITTTGFEIKTFQEILDSMETTGKQAENFGEDFDLRDGTPQKQFFSVIAEELASLWEQLGNVYAQGQFDQAEGVGLDYLTKRIGVRRNQALKAGQLTDEPVSFFGINGTIIPIDFLVETESGIQFKTKSSGTISGGTVDINIEALLAGADGNVSSGTVIVITNPLAGLDTVTNASAFTSGTNQETNEELRARAQESIALLGRSTSNSIRTTLLATVGVTDALVQENDTSATVGGIPPKAISPVVLGGSDNDVATSIFNTKAGGIQSFGAETVGFTDDSGNTITIGFERPTLIDVWIDAVVTKASDYPVDGDTQVKTIIVDYINGLQISDDVILFTMSSLIGAGVPGITNLVLESSTDDITYLPADVTIGATEKAQTENAKVVVTS